MLDAGGALVVPPVPFSHKYNGVFNPLTKAVYLHFSTRITSLIPHEKNRRAGTCLDRHAPGLFPGYNGPYIPIGSINIPAFHLAYGPDGIMDDRGYLVVESLW